MYDNSAIEPYKNRGSGKQYNVGEKSTSVCVCVFSSISCWTSSSLDVPAGVTQEEGRTGFFIHLLSAVRALVFLARRIQPFLSLVDREVEFCKYCTILLIAMQGYHTKTEDTGNLDYNSICYITSRIGQVSMKGIHK